MNSPQISILILTKNAGKRLDVVLRAVFSDKKISEAEVIVVDSGSTDETREIISRYPARLIEISLGSFGHGRTRNLAAQEAKGRVLVFLTQDAVPESDDWLTSLTEDLNIPGVAGVFGRQIPDKGTSAIERFYLSYLYPDFKIIKDSVDPHNCLLKDVFFSNVNSAILKSEWEKQRFNEDLIMSEDQEWSKAMLLKGKKVVYEPKAAVFHSHKYNAVELMMRNFDSGMSLKGIVNAPLKSVVGYQIKYLKEEIRFFIKNNAYLSLALFPFYEFVRSLGFFLGFYSDYLPLFLKKRISQNKAYWVSDNVCL